MLRRTALVLMVTVWCWPAYAAAPKHGIVMGEILKLDRAAKTMAVKTADGTVRTIHVVDRTAVHGTREASAETHDVFHGLKEGGQVAVHETAVGTDETADEIDAIGKDGLKETDGTITKIDRDAKTLTVKTADGAEHTYRLTDRAARDAGKDIPAGAEKSAKVTVYYAEEGGRRIAHFFKRAL